MPDFQLFRVQIPYPIQLQLQSDDTPVPETPTEMLEAIIREYDRTEEVGQWHIGNVAQIDEYGFYFRFGRERLVTTPRYEKHRFVDEALDTVPYTHVLLDTHLELLAIAKEADLSSKPLTIANQLKRYLQTSELATRLHLTITIKPLIDPAELVELIGRSIYVRRFRIEVLRPNAWDVESDFIKPCQYEAGASRNQ